MTYPSELGRIVVALSKTREALEDLVRAMGKPSSSRPWWDCLERWDDIEEGLELVLQWAEDENRDLSQRNYMQSLAGLSVAKPSTVKATQATPEAAASISPKVQQAIDFIREKGPIKGLSVASHIGVHPTTFRKYYSPRLKALGVKNDGQGYYVPDK